MTNLATLEELAVFMRLPLDTIDEDAGEAALAGASALVRDEVGQVLDFVADDVIQLRSSGGRLLLLPELPVIEVTLVRTRLPGGEWIELTSGEDYEVELGLDGALWRIGSSSAGDFGRAGEWPRTNTGRGPNGWVEITYSHGYAVPGLFGSGEASAIERLPETLSTVTKRVAARGYVNPEAVAQEATGGRSTVSYGDTPGLYLSQRDRRDLFRYRPGTRGGSR